MDLQQMDGALPVLRLSDPAAWQDLAGALGPAREARAIGVTEEGVPVILRHDDVEAVLKDLRFGQNDLSFLGHPPGGFVNEWYRQSIAAIDQPDHARLRGLTTRAFTSRRIEELRPRIAEIARQSMLPAIESGRIDAVGRFSQVLPVTAVMAVLGIPAEEMELFFDWAHDFGLLFSFTAAGDPQTEAILRKAMDGLDSYVRDLIARRRRQPGDDLVSDLVTVVAGEDRLTEQELVIMVGTFLYAGVETTEAMMPIIVHLLATHPEQFELLQRRPELVPNAVEEALRFEPNVAVIARVAKERVDLGDYTMEPGRLILSSVVSANRDPRRWPMPDVFRVDREKPKTLGFGSGIHHCIGATLARFELQEATRLLLGARKLELLNDPKWDPFSNTRQLDQVSVAVSW